MKMKAAGTLAVLALLASGFAAAEPGTTVRVPAPSGYKMTPDEFKDYAWRYDLSNGRQIEFSRNFRHYVVALDGEQSTELYPIARGVFMTAAGTRIEFQQDGASVLIRNYERLPMTTAMKDTDVTVVAGR
jgi:hypothetical protein